MTNENRKGYKETKLGWIPEEWEVSTVKASFEICNSGRKPINGEERKKIQGVYPYYGPTKIQDYIDEFRFEGDYALIAEDGDHFLKYSDLPMTQFASGKFNVNNHAHVIRGKAELTCTEWFYWFFYHRSIFSHITRQGAGRYKLNKAALSQLPVLVPPLPEQQKIATILSTWDLAIEMMGQLIEAKEEQKKGLMQRLLTGEVRVKGFEKNKKTFSTKFGDYPIDWSYPKMGEIAENISIKNSNGLELPVLSCTKHQGLVDSLKYFGKQIYSKDTSDYKVVKWRQFAYATNHIEEGSIGYQDLYDSALISPMYTAFETDSSVNDFFLFKVLKSKLYVHIYQANTSASVDRRGSLRWKSFSNINIPLPSMSEQNKIASIIRENEKELSILESTFQEIKLEKKGLMQRLLTGKTRVK